MKLGSPPAAVPAPVPVVAPCAARFLLATSPQSSSRPVRCCSIVMCSEFAPPSLGALIVLYVVDKVLFVLYIAALAI